VAEFDLALDALFGLGVEGQGHAEIISLRQIMDGK
jgi:hypothetical protein